MSGSALSANSAGETKPVLKYPPEKSSSEKNDAPGGAACLKNLFTAPAVWTQRIEAAVHSPAVQPFDALYILPTCAWGVIPFVLAQMPAAAVGNSAAAESVYHQVVWRSFSRSACRARRSS